MEGMKNSLSCPICFELFDQAKTLPCQHVVCEGCIALWAAKRGQLICPTCREEQDIPAGGVSNLPTNFMVNGMVESFKEGLELEDDESDDESPDLNGSSIELSGKSHEHICDVIITCSIQICDSKGKPIRGIDSKRLNATIRYYDKNKWDVVPEKADEKFEVSFIPKRCGIYVVEAFLDGQGINKSPLEVVVHPKGRILSVIRGCMKQPKDVFSDGDSIFVTDSSNGNYLHLDWLGYGKNPVSDNIKVGCAGKDLSPCGIFGAAGNTVYVTDTDSNSVRLYENDRYVCSFGDGNLDQPLGISVDKNKLIYVANKLSNAISVFDEFHMSLGTIRVEGGGKKPSVAPSLACIALNSAEDKLIVADQANCCLKIINLAQKKVEHSITTKVSRHTVRPFGVAVDSNDNIYASVCFTESFNNFKGGASRVSDARERTKGAVLMYNSSGFFLGRFGETELINPGGICVLENANHISILVVETDGNGYGSRAPGLRLFSVA
ncbi:uncharacterized protein [Apostichopus japonicus]|uniref:uncharacterized protein n=1 Tax=Stichopus japonicus TaxID=307972 RepID=UPI003AB3CD6D